MDTDCIRPLEKRDINAVADLHERLVGQGRPRSSDELRACLADIMLENPWQRTDVPSLVYENKQGRVAGFLGIVPRPMMFANREVTAAISHSFLVEPESRKGMAAVRLARELFDGPQDLSIAQANGQGRRVWESMGGQTLLFQTLCWTKPLKPMRYLLSALERRGLQRPVALPLRAFCNLADGLARVTGRWRSRAKSELRFSGIGPADLSQYLASLTGQLRLRPVYDESAMQWLLGILGRKAGRGNLSGRMLHGPGGDLVGWYIYLRCDTNIWKVLQLAAADDQAGEVLDCLLDEARHAGALAVSGALDSLSFDALAARDCLFHHDGTTDWMMVHSRDPAIRDAMHRGDMFLSRLDGEWWISFLKE